jgi:hypothetical protein
MTWFSCYVRWHRLNRENKYHQSGSRTNQKKDTHVSKPWTSKAIERGNLEKNGILFASRKQNNLLEQIFFITRKGTFQYIKFQLL